MSNAKSAASDLFNRYIWLANTVYNSGAITYEEICAKWRHSGANTTGCEMTRRTFHNHRSAILELFDIDIECDKHNGWRYYVANHHSVGNDSLRRWMLSTLAVNNLVRESKDLREKILLEEIPSGLNYLTQIIEVLRERNVIEVTHVSFWRDAQYTITLEPYCIKVFRQRWYVLGLNRELDSVRVYALDRFVNFQILPEQFEIPEEFNGEQFFNEYFGVYVDNDIPLEKVILEADKIQANYLRSLPLHYSQQEIETCKNHSIFEYTIRPTVDFINELVKMAATSKVLSPKWMADEIKSTIANMAKRQRK
ncbi:WYL domain-containing protein [Porphyromonadaceae bacterium]